jgi:hypothetical protein
MNVIKDPVDELLKADAAWHREGHIDDAGFTLRVIDYLPTGSQFTVTARFAIPFGCALIVATFVALFAGGGNFMVDAIMDIATSNLSKSAFAFIAIIGVMFTSLLVVANDG